MSVMEKARELGNEIASSKELLAMRDAESAMLQEPAAKMILQEFEEKRRAFQMIQSQGHQLTESQKKEAEEIEKKMLDNPHIYSYFKAQQDFERILEGVNKIIGEAIGLKSCCSDDENCGCCH
jgi:cell fate (sporulation/competence/biofilm development) regulator YlbF (YheA/YmcA/DUF963 family)